MALFFAAFFCENDRLSRTPVTGKVFNFLLLLALTGAPLLRAETKAHSTSTSRQFIVYGAEVRVRGVICDLAESTKENLLKILRLDDRWKTPLVINLDYPQANLPELPPSHFALSQTGAGLKLQLNLLVSRDLEPEAIQRELLRAVLIEMIYRSRANVAAGSHYASPPDWLLDGFLQLMPDRRSEETARLLRSMIQRDRIMPAEELVRQKRELLEPPARRVHDAYAMALVQLLLGAPAGPAKLARFLADLPDAPNDPWADLRAHFPEVLGSAAEKWWNLSVARLSAADRYEILSAEETARRLDEATHFSLRDRAGNRHQFSLGDYPRYLALPGSRAALAGVSQELLLLGARAHPSYRAIVQEGYDISALLSRGQSKRIEQRLARVASYRAVVEEQEKAMEDYLNWFEATQIKTMSGAFADILEHAHDETEPPRRRDPISVYLDSIEAGL